MNRTTLQSIALVGVLALLGSGCAWLGRASHTTSADPWGATNDRPALSANARYVAYAAHTDTAAPGVLDGVYRWDTVTDTRTVVSRATDGTLADDVSGEPAISADGRYVAFSSDATTLVPNDTNDTTDVFVRDVVAGTTERVSVTSAGAEVSDPSSTPTISDDGRYIAFISESDDLSSLDANLGSDAYVFDRSTRVVRLASIAGGVQPDGISQAVLSGDGKHLAFTTDTDLIISDQNITDDVYLKNLGSGATTWISRPKITDPEAGGGDSPSLSYDGQFVAFVGGPDIDNATDPFPGPDVFVRDVVNKTVKRVSTTATGGFVNGFSVNPAITSNGARVVFSSSGNVSGNDTNGTKLDAFVKDLMTGTVTLVSTDMFLAQLPVDSTLPSVSADGHYAAFVSTGKFGSGDPNGVNDAYVRAIDVPKVTSISPSSANRGASVTITITGSTLLPGATVVPMPGTFVPTATTVNSATSMTVTLAVDANAPTGPQTIFVQDPGTGPGSGTGGVGRCENCVTIR